MVSNLANSEISKFVLFSKFRSDAKNYMGHRDWSYLFYLYRKSLEDQVSETMYDWKVKVYRKIALLHSSGLWSNTFTST